MSDEEWQGNDSAPGAQRPYQDRVFRAGGSSRGRGDRGGDRGDSRRDNTNWRRDDRSDRAPGNFNRNRRTDDGNKKVITIPSSKVGRVIGKGGSKIRDLEYESEARVQINNSNSGGEETEINLLGTDQAIAKVEGMIYELIKDRPPPQ